MAFFTGTFRFIDDSVVDTTQKIHCEDRFDDDVLDTIKLEKEIYQKEDVYDGFVSNVGNIVTIHIKDKYIGNIDEIKHYFGISKANGVEKVAIELL